MTLYFNFIHITIINSLPMFFPWNHNTNLVIHRRCRWVFFQLWINIFIIDIVANSDEFLLFVRASEKNYSHTNSILKRDLTGIG